MRAPRCWRFQRYDLSGHIHWVHANFSNGDFTDYRIGLPQAGNWLESVNSQDAVYGGNGLTNPGVLEPDAQSADGFDQSVSLALPRMGLMVLTLDTGTSAPESPAGAGLTTRLLDAYPNTFNPRLTVTFEMLRFGPVQVAV